MELVFRVGKEVFIYPPREPNIKKQVAKAVGIDTDQIWNDLEDNQTMFDDIQNRIMDSLKETTANQ